MIGPRTPRLLAMRVATAADSPPAWAYTPNNPDHKPPVDDGKPVRVPDSTAGYTWSQLRDRFIAPVWHPSEHGALPDIVANGGAAFLRAEAANSR